MTETEAIAKAKEVFDRTWGKDAGRRSFTGEVRAVDLAQAIDREERRTSKLFTANERERASRYFRVVFVSGLPEPDCGSMHAIYRVDKATGIATEEIYD